jgi:hypothetical protein
MTKTDYSSLTQVKNKNFISIMIQYRNVDYPFRAETQQQCTLELSSFAPGFRSLALFVKCL